MLFLFIRQKIRHYLSEKCKLLNRQSLVKIKIRYMLQNLVQLVSVKVSVLNFVDIPVTPSHFTLVLKCGFFPNSSFFGF